MRKYHITKSRMAALDDNFIVADLRYKPSSKRLHRVAIKYIDTLRRRLKPTSLSRRILALDYIVLALGPMDIDEITPSAAGDAFQYRLQQCAPATVMVEWIALKGMLDWCVRTDQLPANPLAKLRAKDLGLKWSDQRVRWLSEDELAALYKVLRASPDKMMVDAILFAMATGLRLNNQFSLKREQVFHNKREIYIPDGQSKNGRGIVIPLDDQAMRVIGRRMAALQKVKEAYHGWYLFGSINQDGILRPIRQPDMHERWDEIRKAAGLVDFNWHDFRHHRASELVQNGVDILVVKDLLGHKNIAATMRYAHLNTRRLHEVVNAHREKIDAGTSPVL